MPIEIIPLGLDHVDRASALLYKSLKQDPISRYISLERNDAALKQYVKSLTSFSVITGGAFATSNLQGVSLWIIPKAKSSLRGLFKSGLAWVPFKFGFEGFNRIQHISNACSKIRMTSFKEPPWHLVAIGVDESMRERGLASSLLKFAFKEIDRQNKNCYLETANKDSSLFFEKLGFTLSQKILSKKIPFEILSMTRTSVGTIL